MPWQQVCQPAPKNLRLTIHKHLPVGMEESRMGELLGYPRVAYPNLQLPRDQWPFTEMHYCSHCGGWIPGEATEFKVSTLDSSRLAGRQGTEWYCGRCGEQIAFVGLMS